MFGQNVRTLFLASALCSVLFVCHSTMAGATLCVNPGGTSSCYSTIKAAVAAASPNDVINVAAGAYAEDVVINKPLSLVGAGSDSTIIEAHGLANGIYVDGLDNPGLSNVLVTGLTVRNANFEGILVTNASYVVISQNHVTGNNQSLDITAGMCNGIPAFETNEGDDCGEGIHLAAVNHSFVTNNESDLNSGGILLSDETGYTNDNIIAGNNVHDNPFDCGITLASHSPAASASSKLPYGVFHNTISANRSYSNGLSTPGAGAGVGIFAPGPGNLNFGNKVIGNILFDNGLPGVTIHNHAAPPGAPGVNLNDNVIARTYISGNAADTEDAATQGTAGINIYSVAPVAGIVVEGNTIENEALDVVWNAPGVLALHMNNLLGGQTGAANTKSAGSINGTLNYWGCAGGAGASGCASASGGAAVTSTPYLNAPNPAAATDRVGR